MRCRRKRHSRILCAWRMETGPFRGSKRPFHECKCFMRFRVLISRKDMVTPCNNSHVFKIICRKLVMLVDFKERHRRYAGNLAVHETGLKLLTKLLLTGSVERLFESRVVKISILTLKK